MTYLNEGEPFEDPDKKVLQKAEEELADISICKKHTWTYKNKKQNGFCPFCRYEKGMVELSDGEHAVLAELDFDCSLEEDGFSLGEE